MFHIFFCCRFKLLLINEVDQDAVRETVIRTMISSNARASGVYPVGDVATEGEQVTEVQTSHKGSLLTTLTDIVSERMAMGSAPGTFERQPIFLTAQQELTAYLSEPVIPVRSQDGKVIAQDLLNYWYRHKSEWPALTRLALSYLSCPPSSVTSERVFSLTGNIVSKKRCALLPGNIGRLAFIKFNHKKF